MPKKSLDKFWQKRQNYELQKSLWQKGFADDSADGISVPQPVGIIPEWQMWLQRKVQGAIATQFLTQTNTIYLAKRITEVALFGFALQ